MKSTGTQRKIIAAVVAAVASIGMAQAQSSGGGTGAAGSSTSTPSGTNMPQPGTSTGSKSSKMTGGAEGTNSGTSKKANASAQDCRDHANTATGQKRNDTPQNADTDKTCGDMNDSSMSKSKKSTSGATTGQPAPASK
jgi:hypothetical protein